MEAAVARLAGGGIDAILVDLFSPGSRDEDAAGLLRLRGAAAQVPIVVIGETAEDADRCPIEKIGLSAFITEARCQGELPSLIRRLIGCRTFAPQWGPAGRGRKVGSVITVMGSKGGVGATTVALNVACALAGNQNVILAELRPTPGTLAQYFSRHSKVKDLGRLLGSGGEAPDEFEIESCLWPSRSLPGLRVLFGPQGRPYRSSIEPNQASKMVEGLTALADRVVIDLPATPSDANRVVIQATECLLLVAERDSICLESARLLLDAITGWGDVPQTIGLVLVNRTLLATPTPTEDFEAQLGIPVFAVIPPAADDCLAAHRAGRPLVLFDSENLAADTLLKLATQVGRSTCPVVFDRNLVRQ